MRDYELVFIVSPEIIDEEVPKVADKVASFITGKGGSIVEVTQWGRKKLAYPVEQYLEGNYVLTRFKLEPRLAKELETNLRLSNEVLRHLLVRVPEGKKS